MKKTALVFSSKYLEHKTGIRHPESPLRLEAILRGIKVTKLLSFKSCSIIQPRTASKEDLKSVHKASFIDFVKRFSKLGGGLLDRKTLTFASQETYKVAKLAVGGALKAVDKVMDKEYQNAFVISRPPGHHAGIESAMGFCFFNNIALAASYLVRRYDLDRILILDIDAHHGNGTQCIFYPTSKILYISLHEDPSKFPGTGFLNETGEGEGMGYNVNIPFPLKTGGGVYWNAIQAIVIPIITQYKPKFILLSVGFDGYYKDPIGELSLPANIYPRIFQEILKLADKLSNGRIIAVLEGGYNLFFLSHIVPVVIGKLCGVSLPVHSNIIPIDPRIQWTAKRKLEKINKTQNRFWDL